MSERTRHTSLGEKSGQRIMVGTRLSPELKRRLDEAIQQSGRSQAQEIELRLEQSFRKQDLLGDALTLALNDERLAGIVLMVGIAMDRAGGDAARDIVNNMSGRDDTTIEDWLEEGWTSSGYAYDQALQAATMLLEALRPPGGPLPPPLIKPKFEYGSHYASVIKRWIHGYAGGPPYMGEIRRLLGPLAKRFRARK